MFNSPVDFLPELIKLKVLMFGYSFNQIISNFPPYITTLVLGELYDKYIVLSESVINFSFSSIVGIFR